MNELVAWYQALTNTSRDALSLLGDPPRHCAPRHPRIEAGAEADSSRSTRLLANGQFQFEAASPITCPSLDATNLSLVSNGGTFRSPPLSSSIPPAYPRLAGAGAGALGSFRGPTRIA